jgi:hypothetical protein
MEHESWNREQGAREKFSIINLQFPNKDGDNETIKQCGNRSL